MKLHRFKTCLLAVLCLLIFTMGINDGIACETRNLKIDAYQKSTAMAFKLHDALEKYQPEVALIARVGSDLSKYGLVYSHIGIVQRNHPAGKWIVTHLLNHCKKSTSSLFDEGLIPFFSDTPFRYQAQLLIPRSALQNEIAQLLADGTAEQLHERRYSVIANAARDEFQNSNQWVLEVLAVAKSLYLPADQRINALRLAKEQGYQAEQIKLGTFKALGAMLFRPNVKFSDHDVSGFYPVVSVRSIVNYLKQNNDLMTIEEIRLNSTDLPLSPTLPGASQRPAPRTAVASPKHQSNRNTSEALFWQ